MPYHPPWALSADEAAGSPILEEMNARTKMILAKQEQAETWRKWQAIVAVFGSVFAAVRLGIIAMPHVRARVRRPLGALAGPVSNPRRRRRR